MFISTVHFLKDKGCFEKTNLHFGLILNSSSPDLRVGGHLFVKKPTGHCGKETKRELTAWMILMFGGEMQGV